MWKWSRFGVGWSTYLEQGLVRFGRVEGESGPYLAESVGDVRFGLWTYYRSSAFGPETYLHGRLFDNGRSDAFGWGTYLR